MIFIHGGGFAYQAAPHHFSLARRFAKKLNCKVFMVDYRLAPKYKFPQAPNDSFTCYRWILDHAGQLKIDKSTIVICGDSAGGNLATVVSIMARDKEIQLPCAQVLLYPVTDRRMHTESMKQYADTPMCNTKDMEKRVCYLRKKWEETEGNVLE